MITWVGFLDIPTIGPSKNKQSIKILLIFSCILHKKSFFQMHKY